MNREKSGESLNNFSEQQIGEKALEGLEFAQGGSIEGMDLSLLMKLIPREQGEENDVYVTRLARIRRGEVPLTAEQRTILNLVSSDRFGGPGLKKETIETWWNMSKEDQAAELEAWQQNQKLAQKQAPKDAGKKPEQGSKTKLREAVLAAAGKETEEMLAEAAQEAAGAAMIDMNLPEEISTDLPNYATEAAMRRAKIQSALNDLAGYLTPEQRAAVEARLDAQEKREQEGAGGDGLEEVPAQEDLNEAELAAAVEEAAALEEGEEQSGGQKSSEEEQEGSDEAQNNPEEIEESLEETRDAVPEYRETTDEDHNRHKAEYLDAMLKLRRGAKPGRFDQFDEELNRVDGRAVGGVKRKVERPVSERRSAEKRVPTDEYIIAGPIDRFDEELNRVWGERLGNPERLKELRDLQRETKAHKPMLSLAKRAIATLNLTLALGIVAGIGGSSAAQPDVAQAAQMATEETVTDDMIQTYTSVDELPGLAGVEQGEVSAGDYAAAGETQEVKTLLSSSYEGFMEREGSQMLENGLMSNWTDYDDIENKVSKNAFGTNRESDFDNREATQKNLLEGIKSLPPMLASFAGSCESVLRRAGVSEDIIAIRNVAERSQRVEELLLGEGGGELQQKLVELCAEGIMNENSDYFYYLEYGQESTFYIKKTDDGPTTALNTVLGVANVQRNATKQLQLTMVWDTGETETVDMNLPCGYQMNLDIETGEVRIKIDATPIVVTVNETQTTTTEGTTIETSLETTGEEPGPGPGPGPGPKPGGGEEPGGEEIKEKDPNEEIEVVEGGAQTNPVDPSDGAGEVTEAPSYGDVSDEVIAEAVADDTVSEEQQIIDENAQRVADHSEKQGDDARTDEEFAQAVEKAMEKVRQEREAKAQQAQQAQ